MKVIWCCRMVIASTKDERKNFCSITWTQGAGKIILETSFSSRANYRLPFKACVLHHYNEISFCNALPGDLLHHMSNLLWSLYSLWITDIYSFLLKDIVHLNCELFIVRMRYIFACFVLKLYCEKLIWALKSYS